MFVKVLCQPAVVMSVKKEEFIMMIFCLRRQEMGVKMLLNDLHFTSFIVLL